MSFNVAYADNDTNDLSGQLNSGAATRSQQVATVEETVDNDDDIETE